MPKTINEWRDEVHQVSVDKGWYGVPGEPKKVLNFGERIALIHSELSEALEEWRNGHELHAVRIENGKPEGVPIELADAVIRILDLCGAHDIDIEEAIRIKNEFNKTRPFRHGNKKA